MKRWALLALGIGCYAAALIATAPATLLAARLRSASGERLQLAQAQGTIWSGRGLLEVGDGRGSNAVVRDLAWRLRPGALFGARLEYEVALGSGSRPFPVRMSWSQIEVANADIDFPAAALASGLPSLAALGLSGDANLNVSRLLIGRSDLRGNASLHWRRASSALTPVSPLGDYQLSIEGQGPRIRTSLSTLQGPLRLDGQGSWPQGGQPEFVAIARVSPQFKQQLAPFLRLVAVEQDNGSFEWRLK